MQHAFEQQSREPSSSDVFKSGFDALVHQMQRFVLEEGSGNVAVHWLHQYLVWHRVDIVSGNIGPSKEQLFAAMIRAGMGNEIDWTYLLNVAGAGHDQFLDSGRRKCFWMGRWRGRKDVPIDMIKCNATALTSEAQTR